MKTITKEWLVKNGACEEGIEWFKAQGTQDTKELLKKAVKDDATYCIKFFIEKAFNKDQSVKLAVYSARLCLENFERKFPDDDRPRKAIEAAENWIKNQCKETELAARSAARSAWSAAWSAARSAWSAAWSAESAARSAGSAWSAAWSAESAARKEIIDYICELI